MEENASNSAAFHFELNSTYILDLPSNVIHNIRQDIELKVFIRKCNPCIARKLCRSPFIHSPSYEFHKIHIKLDT